jgi:excisionase family DNA binding protein
MENPDDVFTVAEVAALKGVAKKSVYRAIRKNRLVAERRGEKTLLVKRRDLDAWRARRGRFDDTDG